MSWALFKKIKDDLTSPIQSVVDTLSGRLTAARASKLDMLDDVVAWADKDFETSTETGVHYDNTHLDITGSGYIVGTVSTSTNSSFSIQIDGGTIYRYTPGGGGSNLFPLRFNSGLVVKCESSSGAARNAWVVLD